MLVAFVVLAWLFLWIGYPHLLSYQEQNQLFLFTGDYLVADLSRPGGLADYIGEFVVQFYYVEWLGALLVALILALMQWLFYKNMCLVKKAHDGGKNADGFSMVTLAMQLISFLLPLGILALMSDENMIFSYPIAIVIALAVALVPAFKKLWLNALAQVVGLPLMYWLIGPMVWLYIIIYVMRNGWKYLFVPLICVAMQAVFYHNLLLQWPLEHAIYGFNYYRIPLLIPSVLLFGPCILALIAFGLFTIKKLVKSIEEKTASRIFLGVSVLLVVVCVFNIYSKFSEEDEKFMLIEQDYFIRNERWEDVIKAAEKHQVEINFSSEAVNLSLAMTGQLAERMFQFYQSGEDALLMPMIRDNTSNLPTMEAFWRLGMVNESMRYAFDIQESILNGRKSGRLTKRIAECCIVNGKYEVAHKHIDLLKKSLFYRRWAKEAETFLGKEQWINNHSVWGPLRKKRYKNDFLYNYPEMDKMLGLLFINNNSNKMALEYFLMQNLLKGNMQAFMEYLPAAQQYGGYSSFPAAYRDAYECIQKQGNVPGSPYAEYVKRMMNNKSNANYEEPSAH